jgi:methylenetetrahydrofolate reductase (NADPH)
MGDTYAQGTHHLGRLVGSVRFEVMPTASIADEVLAHVPRDVTLAVTASPTRGLDATLALTERLSIDGYRVVPHVAARMVVDRMHLTDIVARLRSAGVDDIFVPAGDAGTPHGRYEAALPLLADLSALGQTFTHVGITGYPQSHPLISDDETVLAMTAKAAHATYVVSNLCLDARALRVWVTRVRGRGVSLPISVGLSGPVDRTRLFATVTKIGVGDSARFLGKHLSWAVRVAAPGGYSPDRMLRRVADTLVSPDAGIAGLHVFTFNQVARTEQWRRGLLARAGRVTL